jgi:Superinfection immunity protein
MSMMPSLIHLDQSTDLSVRISPRHISAVIIPAVALAAPVYFAPWFIARRRDIVLSRTLFYFNLLTGWTVIGWALCMFWAAHGQTVEAHAAIRRAVPEPQSRA